MSHWNLFQRALLLIGLLLGIGGAFYLSGYFHLPWLGFLGILALVALARYGSAILIGGDWGRLIGYFNHRQIARLKLLQVFAMQKRGLPADFPAEDWAVFFALALAHENIEATHQRLFGLEVEPNALKFDDAFFERLKTLLLDSRALGLSRAYRLRLAGFGETAARHFLHPTWAEEFRQQRETIFRQHAEGLRHVGPRR